MTEVRGVLVMAYGTPGRLDEVEAYYTDIRGGSPPPAPLLEELIGRYLAIGGRSPLLEITTAQARGIQQRLGIKAYVGLKHASPFISEAVAEMASDGVTRAVGIVMAPHYSTMSVADYARRAEDAAGALGWLGTLEVVPSWHLEPGYVRWLAHRVTETLGSLPGEAAKDAAVIFTAHSLPRRILERGDPYPGQLHATARAVAEEAGLKSFRIGWQSAGRTGDEWLGPDILDLLRELGSEGAGAAIVCPCGFVADHLEILYDLDIEAKGAAEALGLAFARTRSPNADPAFLDVVASVVRRALERA